MAGITTNSSATGDFHPVFGNYGAVAWNTNIFKTAPNFTKWSDITNPAFKGQMVVDKPTRLSTFGGILNLVGENLTGSQWVSFMNQFKANQPILTASLGDVFTDLSSGQAGIGISTTDDLVMGVQPGVPVAYKWVNPIPVLTSYYALSKGAPHPNTGKLFIMFSESMAGQVSQGNAGRLPMLPAAAAATILKSVPPVPSGFNFVVNPDQKLLNNQTAILNLYTNIFGA
jgi:ABC-type Fe3+ transport system substrate-binding protein